MDNKKLYIKEWISPTNENSSTTTIRYSRIWVNFLCKAGVINVDSILKEYKATQHIDYNNKDEFLIFDTEQDKTLFLLKFSCKD